MNVLVYFIMKNFSKVVFPVLLVAFVLSSCAKNLMFNWSAVVPAAQGDV